MQNDSAGQKPTHTIRNAALSIALAGVLIFLILFVKQVLSIRNEILSGTYDFERYGEDISGSGGANIDQSRTFDVATQDDPSLGPPDAAVTIVEFGDFECPFCLKAFPIIRSLAQAFKDDVRLVYRDFPLDSIHPTARVAALAGYCAHAQGLFWPLHDKLFQNQENLSRAAIVGYANQVGVDPRAFASCLDSRAAKDEVAEDVSAGEAAGVRGTPTWFINGVRVAGVIPEDVFRQIINDVIARNERSE